MSDPLKLSVFAKYTEVPVEKTQHDIQELLRRYEVKKIATSIDESSDLNVHYRLMFEYADKRFQFKIKAPPNQQIQKSRTFWRCVLLVIKGKLEAVANGIETFEEAFMPYIVLPNGQSLKEYVLPQIDIAYQKNEMPALLNNF